MVKVSSSLNDSVTSDVAAPVFQAGIAFENGDIVDVHIVIGG